MLIPCEKQRMEEVLGWIPHRCCALWVLQPYTCKTKQNVKTMCYTHWVMSIVLKCFLWHCYMFLPVRICRFVSFEENDKNVFFDDRKTMVCCEPAYKGATELFGLWRTDARQNWRHAVITWNLMISRIRNLKRYFWWTRRLRRIRPSRGIIIKGLEDFDYANVSWVETKSERTLLVNGVLGSSCDTWRLTL